MADINDDIKAAVLLTEKKTLDNISYRPVFLFGTESLDEPNKYLQYDGKSVLTVAASGDQYLSAVFNGATSVDMYDINKLAFYMAKLKIAAIKALDNKEFLRFMVYDYEDNDKEFLSIDIFDKITPYLDKDSLAFWDPVLKAIKRNGLGNFLFKSFSYYTWDMALRCAPFYTSKANYMELKSRLMSIKEPNFYHMDVRNISNISEKYDLVYLSNIIECLIYELIRAKHRDLYSDNLDIEKAITDEIVDAVTTILNTDGEMMLNYRVNVRPNMVKGYLFSNPKFKLHKITSKYLPYDDDYGECADTDLFLTYKPGNKR